MAKQREQLETLSEIRTLMERSSRFTALSGLSVSCAGVLALIGAALAYAYHSAMVEGGATLYNLDLTAHNQTFYLLLALVVFVAAVGLSILFIVRKARRQGLPVWNITAREALLHLAIPLLAGAVFCVILLLQNMHALVAPSALMFYGLGLVNASKFTLPELRYLGLAELGLGLLAAALLGNALIFWSIGFGVFHIVYGSYMYYKYER